MSKWHGGKGSKRRPMIQTQEQFEAAWDNIFVRKETPKHAAQKVHKVKTKVIPRKKKYKDEGPKYEGPWGKDLGY